MQPAHTIQARVLYNLRDLTGFISGNDLHGLFRDLLDGEPSPSGNVLVDVKALCAHPLGKAAYELLNRPLIDAMDEIVEYTL